MKNQALREGVRIADEGIYLQENRYKQPKEQFKQVYQFLDIHTARDDLSVCDVGCATGELLYFIRQNKPQAKLTGIDVSESMLAQAKKELPSAEFRCASVNEPGTLPINAYDVVTMVGVIGIFDDLTNAFQNCINATAPKGKVLVLSNFNPHPVDLITRYRRADKDNAVWELGWNIHSQATTEKLLKNNPKVESWSFRDFSMPFAIAPQADPMRCWTTRVGDKEHFHVNGALMLVDIKMLLIQCK